MTNYVIINGVNSNTINGLGINELPPITKPLMRSLAEEIDGRDGDITTNLGYSAYDKTITIGLFGTGYDINNIVAFFNGEGTIVFSNEPDKYYNFKILNQIDYVALQKFKSASITFHCQPFKYPLTETPLEIEYSYIEDEGESLTLNDTGESTLELNLKGNTSQTGTPTPSTPIDVNVVSGDNDIVVCGKNLTNANQLTTRTINGITITNNGDGSVTLSGTSTGEIALDFQIPVTTLINGNTYTFSKRTTIDRGLYALLFRTPSNQTISNNVLNTNLDSSDEYKILTCNSNVEIGYMRLYIPNNKVITNHTIYPMLEKGSSMTTFEPYQSQTYEVDLPVENLFNINATPYQVGGNTTYSVNGNTLNVKGEWFIAYKINVSKNTDYYISANRERISGTAGEISIYDGSVQTQIANASLQNYTFNSGNNSTINIVLYAGSGTSGEANFTNIQLEPGTKANSYQPYGTTPLELCKIGDYQDYFTKNSSGQWCKYNAIGKYTFTGSETLSLQNNGKRVYVNCTASSIPNILHTSSVSQTYGLYSNKLEEKTAGQTWGGTQGISYDYNSGANAGNFDISINGISTLDAYKTAIVGIIIYYILETPYLSLIEDTDLISQLDNIQNAMSYQGTTNIGQVNDDKAFIISVKALKEGTNEVVVNNIGNTYSKPLIALEGSGNVDIYLDNTQILKANVEDKMNIDIAKLEAYNPDTSALLNRQVIGNYNTMTLQPGNNTIKIDGALDKATISNYTRWL